MEDKFGCKTTLLDTILVGDIPKTVWKLNDNQPEKCLLNNSFSFINQSSSEFGTPSYLWNFGNGTISKDKDPIINYTSAGTYPVTLTVSTSTGCESAFSSVLKVNPQPVGSYTINNSSQCITGNSFIFRAISDAKNLLNWDFGDNTTEQGKNVTHSYSKSGTYSVVLSISNEFNCTEKITQVVEVIPNPSPTITVNFIEQPLLTNQFEFTTVNESNSIQYNWNFGDGATTSGTSVSHTFSKAGTYTIQLNANNSRNCSSQTSTLVTVSPNPDFSFDINQAAQCLSGNSFVFTPLPAPLPANINYTWTLNGVAFYTGSNTTASITVPNAGNYIIGMTLIGSGSNSVTVTKTIIVYPNPTVNFTINKEKQCLNQNLFAFSSTSTQATTFSWNFGDGSPGSPASSTIYSYTKAGTYSVTASVFSSEGCEASETKTVEVFQVPNSTFSVNNPRQSVTTNIFELTATEGLSQNLFSWDLGNNSKLTGTTISYTYPSAGIYSVKLKVTDPNQCSTENAQTIEVFSNSNLSFEVNKEQQCLTSNSFSFSNTSRYEETDIQFLWYLNDALFYSGNQPISPLTFNSAQQFQIKLVSIGTNGNRDSTTKIIRVLDNPESVFTIENDLQQCQSTNEFKVLNKSSVANGTFDFIWEFDGKTSDLKEPAIQFNQIGTYSITLIAKTEAGCTGISSKTVTIVPNPVAAFSINNDNQCELSNSFLLDATSSSLGSTFLWNLPNGTTSSQPIVSSLSSLSPGTYSITLTVTNSFGCQNSKTKEITVLANPVADFNVNQTQQCLANNLFEFTNTSSISRNSTLSYLWKIGNNFTTELSTPNPYPFNATGTYTITLSATSLAGNCTASKSLTVTVNPNPIVDFTINKAIQCASNNNFEFDAGTFASPGSSILWNLPNGATSTQSFVSNFFLENPGTYSVTLTITNNLGCQNTKTKEITTSPDPQINLTVNKIVQCIENNRFTFSVQPNTTISAFAWNFGDGTISNEENPTHTYQTVGKFPITLQATSAIGCIETITTTIETINNPPADFTVNSVDQALSGNNFIFTPILKDGFDHLWQFGDGISSFEVTPSHTYTRTGSFKVIHTVSNGEGCSSAFETFVNVNTSQSVKFSINKSPQCLSGNEFLFSNTSLETNNISFKWYSNTILFFEGISPPTQSFSNAGTYLISLEAIYPDGSKDIAQQNITIEDAPTASFSSSTINTCLNSNEYNFTPISEKNQNLTFTWKINNVDVSNQRILNYKFSNAATFTVTLNISSISGCSSTFSTSITVNPNPNAEFTINNNTQCDLNNNFLLDATASSSGSSFLWNLPNGTTSSQPIVSSLSSLSTGSYSITLTATNSFGCQNSKTKEITVLANPVADFNVNQTQQCLENNLFEFTNTSSISSNSTLSYLWKIGNNFTTELSTPNLYPFNASGTYTITLSATSLIGNCTASKSITVTVQDPISTRIKVNESKQCLNTNNFIFEAITSNASSVKWDFNDFTKIEQGLNISHTFKEAKSYLIKAIASNGTCTDTGYAEIEVLPLPILNLTINDPEQCLEKNQFELTADGTIENGSISSFIWNLGDGNTKSGEKTNYTYNSPGLYTISLTGTSSQGCIASASKKVNIIDAPKPSFTVNTSEQCLTNNSFVFTASFIWKMGDGNSYETRNVTHRYSTENRFIVNLIANYETGCRDSIQTEIIIKPSQISSFTLNSSTQCENNNNIEINNTSTDPLGNLSYTWLFGDGTIKRDANPTHTYNKDGNYTIKLITSNVFGCLDSISNSVSILDLPERVIQINDSIQCLKNNNFILTGGNLQDPNTTYTWVFEPDIRKAGYKVDHQIQSIDTVSVKLIISKNGCTDSTMKYLYIAKNPIAGYLVNDSIQCAQNNLFVFTNTSTGEFLPFSFEWKNNDIVFSNEASPSLKINTPGSKKINLLVRNSEGCIDSIQKILQVIPNPVVRFDINDSTQCVTNNLFSFINGSTSPLALTTYIWKIDNQQVSTSKDYTFTSRNSGTKNIKLLVSDAEGCTDSLTKFIAIGEQPIGKTLPVATAVVNRQLQLNARVFTKTNYNWTPKIGLNNYLIPNPVFQYDQEVLFTIAMENEFNCKYTDTLKVLLFKEKDIIMPKAFSPNGDGINDVIKPFLIGIQEFKFIRIFNRWGNLVFETKDENKGWDGFYKGSKQAMETYTWIAEGIDIDGLTVKKGGNFILLR